MEIKRIETEAEYEAALERVASLLGAKAGTRGGRALDLWALLVEDYERRHYPVGLPDPVAAIRFRMEQAGLKPADLARYLGGKSKISEVLGGKRRLSLSMIRNLHEGLGIPAEALLGKTATAPRGRKAAPRPAASR